MSHPSGSTTQIAETASNRSGAVLNWSTLGLYALPGSGVNFLFSLILLLYLKYATDVLGIGPGVMGAIFFVSRIWDAVSDPLAGSLSDRTRSRFGRRKPWLLASSLPLAVATVAMWSPLPSLSGAALTAWIALSVFAFYTAYTLFEVPHMALGAELTHDPKARIRVFGARQLLRTCGLFAAGAIGAALLESPEDPRRTAFWLAAGAAAFSFLAIAVSVALLPAERAQYAGRGGEKLSSALRDVWRNRHARQLLLVFFLESLGTGGIGSLAPYVVTYVMKTPDLLNEMLIAYMGPTLLSIPFWVRLGTRFEKRKLWLAALGISALGFGLLFFAHQGSVLLVLSGAVVAGIGTGCGSTVGQALKADIIDVDEYETGERKEGAYFAAWNFIGKLASGVTLGIVGLTLELVSFVPNQEQSELTRFAMRFLMGGLPFLGIGLAIAVFSRFELSEAEHARIRREIEARAAPKPARSHPLESN